MELSGSSDGPLNPNIHKGWVLAGLVRVTGIEPVPQAWEAHVLPLNYTRSRNAPQKLRELIEKQGNFQFRSPLQFLVVAKWQGI